jgi:hypothetical protein
MVQSSGLLEGGSVRVGLRVVLRVVDESSSDLEAQVEQVMDALMELETCHEQLLDATLALTLLEAHRGVVEADLTIQATSQPAALELGLACLRAAIHKTGGETPDWEDSPHGNNVALYTIDESNVRQLRELAPA